MQKQYYPFTCSHCGFEQNAASVASQLEDEVLLSEAARRYARKQTPHAGPGRPTLVRCPGCDNEMSSEQAREHRAGCVRDRLEKLKSEGWHYRLSPKDADPYPDFSINQVSDEEVRFYKVSSGQDLPIELRKVAEITCNPIDRTVAIRLLGRVHWEAAIQRWTFQPSRIGRPRLAT